jgi:histidine kinase
MLLPEGYTLQKMLAVSARSELALAVRDSDQMRVLLKAYGPDGDVRLEREFAALRACAGPGVPRAVEIVREAQSLLVLEHVAGMPLAAWIAEGLPGAEALLALALQLSEILVRMHGARLIHRDLGAHNVLVEPQPLRVHVIGFGRAQPLGTHSQRLDYPAAPGQLPEALHYIAPERTGRMNRGIDPRSDLYSLGATLYLAATGRTPFTESDALGLVHAHIARIPSPAAELNPELPEAISRILTKLLEKEPSERYQSANALRADLRLCAEQLAAHGRIDAAFRLGSSELPDRPRFGSTLHGREAEIAQMRACYAQAAQGRARLLLIMGDAGVGKSALVDALRPDLAATQGYLGIGKFDLSHERPYSGWCAVLGNFVQQLLVESDDRLARWRDDLRAGLGALARVIVDLIPDLGFVLGDTPEVPKVGPRETQARLTLALQRLLASCATPDHPLVLFLDDLQWSDAASCRLLEDLAATTQSCSLLLIGAYRSSEVDAQHPVAGLSRLAQQRGPAETIQLLPLSLEATAAMLAATLERAPEEVRDLALEVERKTGNAPLLVRQFVEHIHGRGILRFVAGAGWHWDPAEIAAADIPEGAIALMSARMQRLSPPLRSIIELASCAGDEFDADLLAELSERPGAELRDGLFALVDAGLIAPCARGFRFVHDRVREAARSGLGDDARAAIHCSMARLLLAHLSEVERERRLFEVAEHQAQGLAHLAEAERAPALELQVRAGRRALAAGAAATAEIYLASARSLLRADDWQTRQAQAVDLHLASAESAFLRGELERALAHVETVEQHPLSIIQQSQAEAQRIQVFALSKEPDEVAVYTLQTLRRFGARWPLHPSRLRTILELQALRCELWLRGVDRVMRPAQSVDPRRVAILRILAPGGVILGRSDDRIAALLACWATRQNLRHGYLSRPAYSLNALAAHGFTCLGRTAVAERISALAMKYSRLAHDPIFGPRAEYEAATLLHPWVMPRRKALAPLEGISDAMRELGDIQFGYYCDFQRLMPLGLAGDPLVRTEARLREQVERVQRAGHFYLEPECSHHAYALLLEPDLDAIPFEQKIAEGEAKMALGKGGVETFARSVWTMVLCIYGRFELAFAQSEAIFHKLFHGRMSIHVSDHVFFRAIAAAELARNGSGRARARHRRALLDGLQRLRRWERQRGSPDFAHMALLLDAQRLRLAGRVDAAGRLYDGALRGAEQQGYPHHAALAAELRGRMLLELRLPAASLCLKEAARRYREWGCEAKARALERRY